jgi:hypothetical protein
MMSESTRATSAFEARYRIDDPNSRPRAVKVVALDGRSEALVKRLAQDQWDSASFLIASAFTAVPRADTQFSMGSWLIDIAGRSKDLVDEIGAADLVVMIATAGENVLAASVIGEACSIKRVTTTAFVLASPSTPDEALSRTLAQLRPWALMLVIASADDYVADMLRALRA